MYSPLNFNIETENFKKQKHTNSESLVQVAQHNSHVHCPNYIQMTTTESISRGPRVNHLLFPCLWTSPEKHSPDLLAGAALVNWKWTCEQRKRETHWTHLNASRWCHVTWLTWKNKGKRWKLYGYLMCWKAAKPSLSTENLL